MQTPALWIAQLLVLSSALIAPTPSRSAEQSARPSGLITIGPGGLDQAEEAVSRCPTFLWGSHAPAVTIELAVYRVADLGAWEVEDEPALWTVLDGRAPGWTPGREQCLEPGSTYAWSVRSRQAEPDSELGDWAEPRWLSILAGPSDDEIAAMLEARARARRAGSEESAVAGSPSRVAEPSAPSAPKQGFPARRSTTPGAHRSPAAGSAPSSGNLGLGGDLIFSAGTDHDVLIPRAASGLEGKDLVIRAGSASLLGALPRAGGHLVLQAGGSENDSFSGVRAGNLVLRSGANGGLTALTGGDVMVQIGKTTGIHQTVLSVLQGNVVQVASNAYLRLVPQVSPPTACTASVRGSIFYDSTKDDLCLCNGSDSWIAMTGTGTCAGILD